jgi:hypothetical protein
MIFLIVVQKTDYLFLKNGLILAETVFRSINFYNELFIEYLNLFYEQANQSLKDVSNFFETNSSASIQKLKIQ